ncbi:MAG: 2-C-methyl-D-erythritol 4-phosphate cytidylyltransferase [Gammaproteobacteria bacterium]|nr:2-C-methyl-D-erythritol 4-phosphate cytidylyltransferase [Gammaproteobacteria bacterium]
MSSTGSDCWALVVAAGIGSRFGSDLPKQYQRIAGTTLLEHSLEPLLSHPSIAGAVVVLATADDHWAGLNFQTRKPLLRAAGGASRSESVLNGLRMLEIAQPEAAWVLVHDGVRPCLSGADLDQLVGTGLTSESGAILATPLTDTLKRVGGDGRIQETLPRSGLYRAQTPQMFRPAELIAALDRVAGRAITDEAAAMELAGLSPVVVKGSPLNIKVTERLDLQLAAAVLESGLCE